MDSKDSQNVPALISLKKSIPLIQEPILVCNL